MSIGAGELFGGSGRRVRDAVWGDIPIDRAVRSLLETGDLLRLKGMGQLGFASQVFPSARHSRHEHAIGVYHLTDLVLKKVIASGAYLEDQEVRSALAAALLLEVGEYPYSCALGGIALSSMTEREELQRRSVEDGEVSEVLWREWELEPHGVLRLVSREEPHDLMPTERFLRDILFGALDADALDRLLRDARAANVPYAAILDVEALIHYLRIVGQDNRAVLAVDDEGAGALQSLFFCRYLMSYNVYGHHSLRSPTAMLLRAAQDAIESEAVAPEKLCRQDDAGAFLMLQDSAGPESSTGALMGHLAGRSHYFRALELDGRHPSHDYLMRFRGDSTWRRRVEEAWSSYLTRYRKGAAGPHDILIDLPPKEDRSIGLQLIRRSTLPGETNPVSWQELSGMTDDALAHHGACLHRIRIFAASKDLAAAVRRHTEELLTIAEEIG